MCNHLIVRFLIYHITTHKAYYDLSKYILFDLCKMEFNDHFEPAGTASEPLTVNIAGVSETVSPRSTPPPVLLGIIAGERNSCP